MAKIICVVPTCRPESHAAFVKAWAVLFEKHHVTLITVWDGDEPMVSIASPNGAVMVYREPLSALLPEGSRDLFCQHSDVCRNIGFMVAAKLMTDADDVLLTMDDDVAPQPGYDWEEEGGHKFFSKKITNDPIQAHLDALARRVPLGWMNTAHEGVPYLRGVPYGIREEASVMLSHGVWVGTPDFDGHTQLWMEGKAKAPPPEGGVPYTLPYFVGPVPRHVHFPVCGMNVAIRREALPYFYFAPMGPDSGVEGLNRFGDIWMGVFLKHQFDQKNWAIYTGASTVLHTRASDAQRNFEQEKLGREWNERITPWKWLSTFPQEAEPVPVPVGSTVSQQEWNYFRSYADKRKRWAALINKILGG